MQRIRGQVTEFSARVHPCLNTYDFKGQPDEVQIHFDRRWGQRRVGRAGLARGYVPSRLDDALISNNMEMGMYQDSYVCIVEMSRGLE